MVNNWKRLCLILLSIVILESVYIFKIRFDERRLSLQANNWKSSAVYYGNSGKAEVLYHKRRQNPSKFKVFSVFFLAECTWFCRQDSCFLFQFQPLHQPSELLPTDRFHFICTAGPFEVSVFQSLIEENKPIAFPQQCFDSVTAFSAEQIQSWREWIQLKLLLHKSS